jgi:hypothetical protein
VRRSRPRNVGMPARRGSRREPESRSAKRTFWASWEVEDAAGDSVYLRVAEEAVAWGRAPLPRSLVRLGTRGDDPSVSPRDATVFASDGGPNSTTVMTYARRRR